MIIIMEEKIGDHQPTTDTPPTVPEPQKYAKLTLPDGSEHKLPVLEPTHGPPMVDVRSLHAATGHFTFDPGFMSAGSCASAITYIDGGKGWLWYRGYSIEDLAKNCTFIEVCFLLLYKELPSKADLAAFEARVKDEMLMHEKLKDFFKGFNPNAHPMAIMVSVIGALSAFLHEGLDIYDSQQRELAAIKLIAKFPSLAAAAYRTSVGLPIVYPRRDLSYAENFLYMMFADPTDPNYKIPAVMTEALDKILILHADHEQNASTFTVRIAGSSLANPYACIAAGIASLWGPAHGGANEACLKMLDEIKDESNIPAAIERAKDKTSGFRLMGFGHRVYKNFDPRSTVMQEMCHKLLDELGSSKKLPLFKLALGLEKCALEDEYFVKRKLYPNVDFYSGIVLEAMNITVNIFLGIFMASSTIPE